MLLFFSFSKCATGSVTHKWSLLSVAVKMMFVFFYQLWPDEDSTFCVECSLKKNGASNQPLCLLCCCLVRVIVLINHKVAVVFPTPHSICCKERRPGSVWDSP